MKKILLFFTLNFLFITAFAQQNEIDSLKQVIATAKEDTTRVKAYFQIANNFFKTNTDTAIYYYNRVITEADNSFDTSSKTKLIPNTINYKLFHYKGNSLYQIGLLYYYQNNYPQTIQFWERALKVYEKIDKKNNIASTVGNIGLIYRIQGNFDMSLKYKLKSVKIYQEQGDTVGIAKNIRDVGNVYLFQSKYKKALNAFFKALELHKKINSEEGIAADFISIATVYSNQSNFEKALEYYLKSLKISKKNNYKDLIQINIGNIGGEYRNMQKYDKAIEYHKKALKIAEELGDKKSIAYANGNIGFDYNVMNNNEQALIYMFRSLEGLKAIGSKYAITANLINIGSVYQQLHQYEKSIIYFNEGLDIAKEIGALEWERNAYSNISGSYWATKQIGKASKNLNKLIEIDNYNILLNFSFISEKEKELYFEGVSHHYNKYNTFVLQNTDSFPNMVETVYNNTIKNKGLLLKSNTAMRNAIHSSKDSALIQEYDNWIVLKRQIAKKYSNGEDASVLENKADSLEGNLVKNSNEFSDFKKVQNITWQQVQNSLKENEIAIEFTHFPLMIPDSGLVDFTNQIQYVALILTKNSKPKMIPLFEEKQLEKIIGKFGGNNYSYINSIYGKNTEVNKELYNLIWKPIDNFLDSISFGEGRGEALKVYISTSGLLHKISFSAIAKDQNVYLCDAYDIEVKSSTGKITEDSHTMTSSHRMTTATLFGGITYDTDSTKQKVWNYLEGTKTETQKINKILKKGKVDINYFSNISATEEEFKLIATNSNILHIATHGFFYPDPKEVEKNEEQKKAEYSEVAFRGGSRGFGVNSFVENTNPLMRSGLVFAGANDVWSKQTKNDSIDDGVLTAQEVSNIDMRKTDLVVMSACETGLGDIKGSEGVYGLQRAFKMAGVKYEIMSLWQVPDKETEEFMTSFYKKLIKQKDIKLAFADTQKEMRKKYDPYFWAAFVLIE